MGLALLFAGTAASSMPVFAQNTDRVTVAMAEDIRGMDPRRERDGMSDEVHLHVVEGLVGFTDSLEVKPVLAESMEVQDEGKSYVFRLREGVKFHNGEPLTSAEVKWSWQYLMAENSIWRCKGVFDGAIKVASVETPDPMTVVFTLEQPSGSFLYNMARTDCAQTPILHPDSVAEDGSWNKAIGTGPFVLGERRIGEYTDVTRFADYSPRTDEPTGMAGRKEALVEAVRFSVVADPSARTVGLRSGDIDVAPITVQSIPQLEAEQNLHVSSSPTTVWYSLLLGMDDPLLKDVRIRQAIAAAIDVNGVGGGVSFGLWPGSTTPVSPTSKIYQKPADMAPSVEKAKALLAEAGYAGQPIKLIANKAYSLMFDQAVIVQAMLQAAGINATIETLEWGLQLEHYTKGDYQAQSFGYSGRFDPMGAWERIIGPESRKVWKDPEAIALLDEGMATADDAKMKSISNQLYEKFIEEVPAVSLYHVEVAYGVNNRLDGFKASPLEAIRLWNVAIK